jgi:hypothetical protein
MSKVNKHKVATPPDSNDDQEEVEEVYEPTQ